MDAALFEIFAELGSQVIGNVLGEVLVRWWLATLVALAIGFGCAFFFGPKGLILVAPGFGVGLGVEWALAGLLVDPKSSDD